jgi:hypothetical protein
MRKKLLTIIILSMTYSIDARMPLYAIYTPSHEILLKNFFLPSIQDDFDLHIKNIEQECSSAIFMSQDWTKTTRKKVAYIIQAIEENMGDIYIFSDVDIQFFEPIEDDIRSLMQEKDFLIQKDHPSGIMCSGFFVCRANEKTKNMWQDALHIMETDHKVSDQNALNRCLSPKNGKKNSYDIVWEYLPEQYFGGGTFTGRYWELGKRIPVPNDAKMHHANWTKGIDNKIKQLKYVKMIVDKRRPKKSNIL